MMHTITITEDNSNAEGSSFTATLTFDGADPQQIDIAVPFSEEQEKELEWYFEKYLTFPFTDTTIAARAACSVKEYGTKLFCQVFASDKSHKEYAQLRGHMHDLVIEVVAKTTDFQSMHWEALWDPDRPCPLAVDCSVVRKLDGRINLPVQIQPSAVLNVLVVVARPHGEWDEGYRTISRPLVESVVAGTLRANIDLLRPGSYEALSKRLEERGPGYYHIVHFDCHGALMAYADIYRTGYLLENRYGRPDLLWRRYEGVRAFLHLECGRQVDVVEASEVATLLNDKGVPICILNACQSGKQLRRGFDGEGISLNAKIRNTNIGSRLVRAGVQVVMAMGYSICIPAARILMETVYRSLFAQLPVLEAFRQGRLEMYNCKGRTGHHGVSIDLEDWLLPVVYASQSAADLKLHNIDDSLGKELVTKRACDEFATPKYGFVGRDVEILKIEKALISHNILLVQGMGGFGKTTLLLHLHWWWRTTNFAQSVFYFGYDKRPWTLQQILFQVAQRIFNDCALRQFQALQLQSQKQAVVSQLRDRCYVLMLDNLESVTGHELAIQNSLPPEECARIHDFVRGLVGGQTKVVLGSRNGEEWLGDTFCSSKYHLQGLDPEARSVLANQILTQAVGDEDQVAALVRDDKYLRLMQILAGHPLAMVVVLANLAQQTPERVLTGLEAADVCLDVQSEDKTRSILSCVEYSYKIMLPKVQEILLYLAHFKITLVWKTLCTYVDELQRTNAFTGVDVESIEEALQDAVKWGLLSRNSLCGVDDKIWNMQPVFPYFLKMKLPKLNEVCHVALCTCFKNTYRTLANEYLHQMNSKAETRTKGMRLCEAEYENMHCALDMCIQGKESLGNISECLLQYLHNKSDFQNGLELAKSICEAYRAHHNMTTEMELEQLGAQQWLGHFYSYLNRHERAREVFQGILLICQSANADATRKGHLMATTYHDLGNLALKLGEFKNARQSYEQALQIERDFDDLCSQAATYHQLGIVAYELRDFDEARQYLGQALDIDIKVDDQHSQAEVYHELGSVALKLREFDKARKRFQEALYIKTDFGDRHSQAVTHHELGNVALKLKEFGEARWEFQQALKIRIDCNDRHSQAVTYHELGNVSLQLGDFMEARQNYQRALEIEREFDDWHSQAATYQQLGHVAFKLEEFEESRKNFQQALEIQIEFDDPHSQAATYHELGNVALKLRQFKEARLNFQQVLEITINFDDGQTQAAAYHALGNVALELGEFEEARQKFQQALKINFVEGHAQAATHHQLGLVALKLREFGESRRNFQQALEIQFKLDDRASQAATYHALGNVALESGAFEEARQNFMRALEIEVDCDAQRSQATTHYQLGCVAVKLKEFAESRQSFQRALEIQIDVDDCHSQAATYYELGNVALKLKELSEARQNFMQALEIEIDFGDRHSQALAYCALGHVAFKLREFEASRQKYQRALEIQNSLEDQHSQAAICHALGNVAFRLKDFKEARQNFVRALEIEVDSEDRPSQAATHLQLGHVALQLREFEESRLSFQRALNIQMSFDERHCQAATYRELGKVALQLNEFSAARHNFMRALDIGTEFGDQRSQADTHLQLGHVALKLREFEESRQSFQRALEIQISLDDRQSQAETCHELGRVALELRKFEEARKNFLQALEIEIDFDDQHSQAVTYRKLGSVAFRLWDFQAAHQHYRQAFKIFFSISRWRSRPITPPRLANASLENGNRRQILWKRTRQCVCCGVWKASSVD